MRILLLILGCILIHFVGLAQFTYNPFPLKQSDFTRINQLKFTKCLVYKINSGEKYLVKEAEYGNKGLVAALYEKGTNDSGDSINTNEAVYKFDGKGKLVRIDETGGENGEEITLFTYDAAGKLTKKEVATIDPPTYKYSYNAKGKIVQANITQRMPLVDKDGEFTDKSIEQATYRYIFKYNSKGQLSEQWVYNTRSDKPAFEYKFVWTYDATGRMSGYKMLNSDDKASNKTRYEYNNEGLLSRSFYSDDFGGSEEIYVYEYNRDKQSWMK